MKGTHPTIAIIGGTVWGNRGAESMLVTTIGVLRKSCPAARFLVYSYYPEKDRSLVSDPAVEILDARPLTLAGKYFPLSLIAAGLKAVGIRLPLPHSLSAMRRADVLLDIGGITFADGRAVFLLFNIFTILPALLLQIPVIKLSQAMGPFKTNLNRILAGFFLKRCQHIFARGAETMVNLQDLGLDPQLFTQAADTAMLYQPGHSLSTENPLKVQALVEKMQTTRQQGKRIAALSPSILVLEQSRKTGSEYEGVFVELVRKLSGKDVHFVFLPNATRETSPGVRNNDILAIQQLRSLCQDQLAGSQLAAIDWVDYDINTSSVRAIIQHADVLLTSRFHAMVSGLALGVPTLVIGWSHKYMETLADFRMSHLAFDYRSSKTGLDQVVEDMLKNRDEYSGTIRSMLPGVTESSLAQYDYVKEFLDCSPE